MFLRSMTKLLSQKFNRLSENFAAYKKIKNLAYCTVNKYLRNSQSHNLSIEFFQVF